MVNLKDLWQGLQIFADGGEGAAPAEGAPAGNEGVTAAAALPQRKGAKVNPLADVKYGIQEETVPDAGVQQEEPEAEAKPATENRAAEFEKLIKGEYKDLYDARVQDTIQKRLKGTKDTVDRYNAIMPILDTLAQKYGVEATDAKALQKAIDDDDAFFADEALEKGITVEQLKEIRKIERENAELKREMEEARQHENAEKLYASWLEQSDKLREIYPSFDIETEMQDPRFVNLLRSNVDVRTAYEVLHKDDIIPAAMQFTAQKVEQQLTNKIIAQGKRPAENGIGSASSAMVKSDVSQLTKDDRAEIIRRVRRGEKIRF